MENRSPSRMITKTFRNSLSGQKNPTKENDTKKSPGLSLKFIKKHNQGNSPLLTDISPMIPIPLSRNSLTPRPPLGNADKKIQNLSTPKVFKLITTKDNKFSSGYNTSRNFIENPIEIEDYDFIQKGLLGKYTNKFKKISIQILGQGIFSIVRKAICLKTGAIVVIKSYDKAKCKIHAQHINISQEIEIMQKISHKNIVRFIDSFETEKDMHIIIEYISGISLYSFLKKHVGTRLPEKEAKDIFEQIFSAVEYLHDKNISHGDLKLENILITSSNIVKIIDFGFSSYNDTKKSVFCGTSSYLSPEIVQMTEYFPGPSDIWALGVIFFTLLTGTYPFKASSDAELYKKILKAHIKVPEFMSNEASHLLYRMLRSEPKSRPSIKSLIKDPWFFSDSFNEKDSESRLSLSNSLIKDNILLNKPNDNLVEKAKNTCKISFKRLITIEKHNNFTS
ncbi:hypothetical protein SteCoe_21151 [Stentor coeruleus]|uniref:Protein kinase domain-containing protein n=1 Tax=Stentor coeruleus TaxID=5963 RepID=A0A1R2BQ93_9CILI|nr:hypothetical protein SteCoe_21151 [Stentor coeruleus]